LTVGSEESEGMISGWKKLGDRLDNRNYDELEFKSMVFEGETHMGVIPATHSRALRVLYSD
jgi:hypothetical protein